MASQPGIEIVGAGPAGLVCTIVLAKVGRRVTAREWHGAVGRRFHDDFQGLENRTDPQDVLAELAEAGISAGFARRAVHEGVVFDSNAKPHPVIGEHAGFQDALAGFGLRQPVRSGRLAAESLIRGTD